LAAFSLSAVKATFTLVSIFMAGLGICVRVSHPHSGMLGVILTKPSTYIAYD
jgi:hypothetical protein